MNKIKDEKIKDSLSKKLREKGLEAIGAIYDDASISLSWLEGEPLDGMQANKEIMVAVERLEQEVKGQRWTL